MKTATRFRVECKDHFWYYENLPDAIKFAEGWYKTCRPVVVYKVIETIDESGLVVNRLEQTVKRLQ